jgi:hypothetical protein
MKIINLLLIITLFYSTTGIAQELRLPKSNDVDFVWKMGDGTYKTVEFNNLLEDKTELSDDVLSKVVMNAMVQSRFQLKNKNSFVGTRLNILKTDSGFSCVTYYTGTNAYGTVMEQQTYFKFVNEGDGQVTKMFTR